MQTLIESLREIIGTPDFYIEGTNSYSSSWDYGAMLEYAFCGILVCVVVISVFKLVRKAFD
ncbi:MAG: hypothetical protein J6J11_08155 [Treponema sp.]|nr:hypothetical protein [Clostridia bacterium]MBP3608275.1 hypothetical protein [Treponema sp.]